MVDINTGVTRGAPGYHLEALPDGQQVLVNDRTGMVAVTDPYTGQIVGEVPKSQVSGAGVSRKPTTGGMAPSQPAAPNYPRGVANASTAPDRTGAPVGTPGVYVPGGGTPPAAAAPPSNAAAGPSGVQYPKGVTNAAPGPDRTGQVVGTDTTGQGGSVVPVTQPPPQGPQPTPPGSDLYDWYAVNEALRNAQMNGWQIAGSSHSPIQQGHQIKNPDYDADTNPNVPQYITQPSGDYIIGVVNPATGQMMKLTLGQTKQPDGSYGWVVTNRESTGAIDKAQPGYTGIQRETFADGHEELWGTSSATGAFEKMPGSPENLGNLKGWNDVRQIEQNGKLVWVGTNPEGKPLQPIPGAPTQDIGKYVPNSVKQVTKNGKKVYVGLNAQTQQWEDIPELGSEVVAPTTVTRGQNVYQVDANGNLVLATAIAQPQENDEQWVPAGAGMAKRQVFHNGDWHDDTDTPQKAVDPALQRAAAALPAKGTKIWQPLPNSPNTLVQVTADGNGSFTYDLGPNGEPPPTKKIPGILQPQTVTGAGTEEFLPPQRNPDTGELLPSQRNPNWQPSNVADRVRQLQDMARAKQADFHNQVLSKALTEDEANQAFNQWWEQTIDPAKKEIDQAAQQKQIDEQIKLNAEQRAGVEQQRANVATAQEAGRTAVSAYQQMMPNMVGPGFGAAMNQIAQGWAEGKVPQNLDLGSALTYQGPDLNQLAQQVTNQALAHISPTAANNMNTATGPGTPNYSPGLPQQLPNVDYTSSLQQNRFQPSGSTTTIHPDGTVQIQQQPQTQPAQQPTPNFIRPATVPLASPIPPGGTYTPPTAALPQNMLPQPGSTGLNFGNYRLT